MIPGWPYSVVAALETGRSSWTAVLDAVRLGPTDDATAVTAAQLREVVDRLRAAGHWRPGDPDIWIVLDAGYDVTRLAFLLADLPVELIGRLRSDRVLRPPGRTRAAPAPGRPPRHGPVLALADPATWPDPEHTSSTETTRYGTAQATAWHRLPPAAGPPRRLARPPRRAADHRRHPDPAAGRAPARRPRPETGVAVDQRPGRHRRPMSTVAWQAFLRRFDLEHTFRFLKQTLGWTSPEAARPRRRRPLDLAGHRRAHPTAPGPRPDRRPAPPLGTTLPTRPADPRPGPPRISPPPTEDHPPGQRAETQPTRPRTPTRHPQPAPGTPPRRRQDRHTRPHHDRTTADQGLNDKLSVTAPARSADRAQRGRAMSELASESVSQRLREAPTERSEGER